MSPDHPMTRDQLRELDEIAISRFAVPGIVLMENAGRGLAEWMILRDFPGPIGIVTGKGNNAGDGFVMARHLDNAGLDVELFVLCPIDSLSGDAAVAAAIVDRSALAMTMFDPASQDQFENRLRHCRTLVDAILGTGTRGTVREPFAVIIAMMNRMSRQRNCPLISIDVPSGLDCDSGKAQGECIQATHTVTLAATKPGFCRPESQYFTGEVHVAGIGAPRQAFDMVRGTGKRSDASES